VVKAMTIAYFSPVITEDGFESATRDVATQALIAGFDPSTVARDAVFAALFSSGPQHFPPLGTAKDVADITLEKVRAFAERAFRAQNAVLVVSGAVDPDVVAAASKGRPAASSGAVNSEGHAASQVIASPAAPVTQPFEEQAAAYAWAGPPIASEDEATTLDFISDYLFRADSGTIARSVAAAFPSAFVSGQFITLHDPGVMFVAFGGADLGKLRGIVDQGIAGMQTPLGSAAFNAARQAFEYHLLSDLQTPSALADSLGWYSVEGNPGYAPGASGTDSSYFKAAAAMTPESVARVAAKYLGKPGATAMLQPQPETKGQQ